MPASFCLARCTRSSSRAARASLQGRRTGLHGECSELTIASTTYVSTSYATSMIVQLHMQLFCECRQTGLQDIAELWFNVELTESLHINYCRCVFQRCELHTYCGTLLSEPIVRSVHQIRSKLYNQHVMACHAKQRHS